MSEPSDDITVSISETASEALEIPIEELPPLSDAIDPDALDAILSSTSDAPPPGVTVVFEYAGLEIDVYAGDVVYARPAESPRDDSANTWIAGE